MRNQQEHPHTQEHIQECWWCRDRIALWQFLGHGQREFRVMVEYDPTLTSMFDPWMWRGDTGLACNLEQVIMENGVPVLKQRISHHGVLPSGSVLRYFVLVPVLQRGMNEEQSRKELAQQNLRPAFLHELLAFSAQYPHLQPILSHLVAGGTRYALDADDEPLVFTVYRYREGTDIRRALCLHPCHYWAAASDEGTFLLLGVRM